MQAGPHRPLFRWAALGPQGCGGAVGGLGQVEQVKAFGFVELEGARDRVQYAGGHSCEGAAFEFGVVLDTHPGQGRHFAATQPGHPALPRLRYPGLLRGDLGSS